MAELLELQKPSPLDDLGDDFFSDIEPRTPSPLDDLGDGFFNDVEAPAAENTFHSTTQKIISAPYGTPPEMAAFHDDVENNGGSKGDFFGYVKAPVDALLIAPVKGAEASAAQISTTLQAGTLMQMADWREEVYSRDFQPSDLFSLVPLNPFAAVSPVKHKTIGGATLARIFLTKEQMEARAQGAELYRQAAYKLIDDNQKFLNDNGLTRPDGLAGVTFDIGGVATTVAASIGLTVLTRNPAAAAMLFSQIQKNDKYIEAKEKGFSTASADSLSSMMGAAEGALEFVGVSQFMKLAKVDTGIKRVLFRSLEEAIQEGTQQTAEEILSQTSGLTNIDVGGAFGRVAYSMLLGGIGGLPSAALMEIGNKADPQSEISDDTKKYIADSIFLYREDFSHRFGEILNQENEKPIDEAAQKKLADILNKFKKGEDIDFAEVINGLENVSDEAKATYLEAAKQADSEAAKYANKEIQRGRLAQLDTEIDATDAEVDALEKNRLERLEQGKSIKSIDAKISKLLTNRNILDEERGELLTVVDLPVAVSKNGGAITEKQVAINEAAAQNILVRGEVLRRINAKNTQETSRKIDAAFREGGRQTRLTGKFRSDIIIDAINSSGLSPNEKGVFLKQVQKAATHSMRDKMKLLQQVNSRINNIIQKRQKAEIHAALKQKIKQTKLSKTGKKPIGKYNAQVQKVFNRLLEIDKMSKEAAEIQLLKNTASDNVAIDKYIENKLLRLKVEPDTLSVDDVAELYSIVSGTVKEAKDLRIFRDAQRTEVMDTLREAAISGITANKDLTTVDITKATHKIIKGLNRARATGSFLVNGWYDTLDIIMGKTKDGQRARDVLTKDVAEALLRREKNIMHFGQRFHDTARESLGVSKRGLKRKMRADEKEINWNDTNQFIRTGESEPKPWILSVAQARKIYMELKHPELRAQHMAPVKIDEGQSEAVSDFVQKQKDTLSETGEIDVETVSEFVSEASLSEDAKIDLITSLEELSSEDSGSTEYKKAARKILSKLGSASGVSGNGLTNDMINFLEHRILTPEDKDFADAQLELYKEIYPVVNDIYEKVYGVNLPFEEFYSPLRRVHDEKIGHIDEFLEELHYKATTVSSFAKSRTKSGARIREQSDVSTMMRYINQASHFISMAETARDLDSIFSADTLIAVENVYGKAMLSNLKGMIEDFKTGHNQHIEVGYEALELLRKHWVVASLGAKLNMIPKQASAFVAYAGVMPADQWALGVVDLLSDLKSMPKKIKILSDSDYMKIRGSSQDYKIVQRSITSSKEIFTGKQTLVEAALYPIKIGDRLAIYLGGWSVYKYNRDVLGKSHEEALAAFVEATEQTQQSSMQDKLSRFQAKGDPLSKTATAFMSAPLGYVRQEQRAFRQAFRGEISKSELAKKVFIYHLVLPTLFQYIADGFDWDDEHLLRSAVLGPFASYMFLGESVNKAYALYQGEHYKDKEISFMHGIDDLFVAMVKYAKTGDFDLGDVSTALGVLIGLPVGAAINIAEGLTEDIPSGETHKGALRVLGYTEKTAERAAYGD